jgi:hypothetical protein
MGFLSDHPSNGLGQVSGSRIRQPTLTVPSGCLCTWSVVTAGPGMAAVSELRYASSLCAYRRDHEKHRVAVEPFPLGVA